MWKNYYPIAKNSDIVIQETKDETLVYDLRVNKAFMLNSTIAVVWQHCDGQKNIEEISCQISLLTGKSVNEDFLWLAIDELAKENLLQNADEKPDYFQGISRREAIKRAGLGSMIALPIISSLVAPIAANASSGKANLNEVCVQNTDCVSGCCGIGLCRVSGVPLGGYCEWNCSCTSGRCAGPVGAGACY